MLSLFLLTTCLDFSTLLIYLLTNELEWNSLATSLLSLHFTMSILLLRTFKKNISKPKNLDSIEPGEDIQTRSVDTAVNSTESQSVQFFEKY
ncbi:hypothetical protein HDU92_001193 [Lobulomyces angularis]|nr:hypothetical protein HDU92_001193 [Lobulomyces angularis]